MPELLPTAFEACIEQEEAEALAQSIELERQRAERHRQEQEAERLVAEQEENERIQLEIEEAERHRALQTPQVNAADITRLMIDRMAELAAESQLGVAENDLTESLRSTLRSFFDQTTGVDREYLTRTATEFVSQMRDAEVQRIRNSEPDKRAAMSLIKRAGKIISCLRMPLRRFCKLSSSIRTPLR